MKKSWLWLLAASILLTLAVPFALGGFRQFSLLNSLPWWAAILLAMLAFISWGFNALRTRMLMSALGQQISFREAALTTISAEFAGVAMIFLVFPVFVIPFLEERFHVSLRPVLLSNLDPLGLGCARAHLVLLLAPGGGQRRSLLDEILPFR